MKTKCKGCLCEMLEAEEWLNKGYDIGFDWGEAGECDGSDHCFLFVLDNKGRFVVI